MSAITNPSSISTPEPLSETKGQPALLDIRARKYSLATVRAQAKPSETGAWVGIAAIFMSFAAFTSAMIVREGAAADWRHFHLPSVLYFNTLILLTSSFTLELCRRRVAEDENSWADTAHGTARTGAGLYVLARARYWLWATLALGLIFVFSQYLAWRNLASQGLFLATSPSSSFFYVLTALHAVHLLGGVAGLFYVLRRSSRVIGPAQRSALGAASLYWHFMDFLWLYLLMVLAIKM